MSYDYDLGSHTRTVTTRSSVAQTWVNRGLVWLYGYNHEEAGFCFEEAVKADPGCGFAHWGIAYAIGPNYNKPWEFFSPEEKAGALEKAHSALETAQALKDSLTPAENALIDALAARYPTDPEIEEFGPWNDSFAEAMGPVREAFPDDLDVAALFAEAHMNRTPWALWDLDKRIPAEGASTLLAQGVLEDVFNTHPEAWDHPGLLHMYIHLMEMSPTPEKALPHGDRLSTLVPDSGHLVHMATHIDVLCGDYENVVSRNHAAAAVDPKFVAERGAQNFYTLYRLHNIHFEGYGAMFLGQPEVAEEAARRLQTELPPDVISVAPDLFEGFFDMLAHVQVRFGQWVKILEEPLPENEEMFRHSTAMRRYARTIALANLGRHDEAKAERALFYAATDAIPEERMLFNNSARDVLRVAAEMMEGEVAYKSGAVEEGLAHLRKAVYLDDHLAYEEPWVWMQPTRHALGALLLDAGQYEEAEAVYRADLGLDQTLSRAAQHPRNVWALHGLHECLARRGETAEIIHVKQQLDQALARATVPIRASCYCRSQAA